MVAAKNKRERRKQKQAVRDCVVNTGRASCAGLERDPGIFLTLISAMDAMAHAMVDRSPAVWM